LCCEEMLLSMEFAKPIVLVSFWAPAAWSDTHYSFTSEIQCTITEDSCLFHLLVVRNRRTASSTTNVIHVSKRFVTHNRQICNKYMFVKQIFVPSCTYVRQVPRLNVLQKNQKYPGSSVSAVANTIIPQPPSKLQHVQTCTSIRCKGCWLRYARRFRRQLAASLDKQKCNKNFVWSLRKMSLKLKT
jgi:hypothetical protein